ncbi:hypothetical protein GCM10010971_07170 [Silvimonas amylolytica]|uniref:Uncharacterized protein n=1 Tax=Silvimonas amylolytica TaxID=449663 RepID=A0ABQ2PH18_9NEIS|nr:hypothetical protein GCM10010971_07170 [Silvimonas amylolytica]
MKPLAVAVVALHSGMAAEISRAKSAAIAALNDSDRLVLRCYENAVKTPDEWIYCRKALRHTVSIASAGTVPDLPERPAYLANT